MIKCTHCTGNAHEIEMLEEELSTERARAEKAENNLGACQRIMGDEIASLRSRLAEHEATDTSDTKALNDLSIGQLQALVRKQAADHITTLGELQEAMTEIKELHDAHCSCCAYNLTPGAIMALADKVSRKGNKP